MAFLHDKDVGKEKAHRRQGEYSHRECEDVKEWALDRVKSWIERALATEMADDNAKMT